MEVSFFVNEDALKRIEPSMRSDESGLLNAFDSHRPLIYAVATKVYLRSRKGSYELTAAAHRGGSCRAAFRDLNT